MSPAGASAIRGQEESPWARDVARWMFWDRIVRPPVADSRSAQFRQAIPSHPARVVAPHVVITWVGHSSFLVQLDGVNLLTDPIWSDRAGPLALLGPKRRVPPGIPFDALPPIDAVLLSHNHYDHLDDRTVRRLIRRYPEAAWFAPLGVASFVRARGATRVADLDWWEETSLGAMRLACTPAQHFSARGLRDLGRTLWCGWSILGPSRRVFFVGDSAYHPEFSRIGDAVRPIRRRDDSNRRLRAALVHGVRAHERRGGCAHLPRLVRST